MNIKEEIKNRIKELFEAGTSEGVKRSWEVRRRHLQRYANIISKKFGVSSPDIGIGGMTQSRQELAWGTYDPNTKRIIVFSGRISSKRPVTTLRHELAHHIYWRKFPISARKFSSQHGKTFNQYLKAVEISRKHKIY